MRRLVWIALDAALVVVFAVIGRASHDEPLDAAGIARTALPFLGGLLFAWILMVRRRQSGVTMFDGLYAWAGTLVLGMLFRALIGDGTAILFIVVAAGILAAFLIGWRAAYALITGRRGERPRAKDPRRSGNPAKRDAAR